MDILWEFKTKNFKVVWSIDDDDDVDLSFDESGEVQSNIESGLWVAFISEIKVMHNKTGLELGATSLGGSIYENPEDFRGHIGMKAKGHGSYFSEMVREAIKEARRTLESLNKVKSCAKI